MLFLQKSKQKKLFGPVVSKVWVAKALLNTHGIFRCDRNETLWHVIVVCDCFLPWTGWCMQFDFCKSLIRKGCHKFCLAPVH